MFTWDFAKKLFDGFTIMRWTDFMHPMDFSQIEKSASQAILTYIIGKEYEERTNRNADNPLDWEYIVASSVYGLLYKIATSDLKSTVNNEIKTKYPDALKQYVLSIYFYDDGKPKYPVVGSNDKFLLIDKKEFERYLVEARNTKEKDKKNSVEYGICYIAHKFATYREFQHIKDLNSLSADIYDVEQEIEPSKLAQKVTLDDTLISILDDLRNKSNELTIFYSYFEKLRPQIRWSQTCRIPSTTVLGHSMYTALLTYFSIKELEIDFRDKSNYLVDSFYAALFHDLPESLTRDIISPVKRNISGLDDALKKYEYDQIQDKMIKKLGERKWGSHFLYLLGANSKKFEPFKERKKVLGTLIEEMDKLAAFMEAKMSVDMGVNSVELQKGIKYTKEYLIEKGKYPRISNEKCKNSLSFYEFFASIPQHIEGTPDDNSEQENKKKGDKR